MLYLIEQCLNGIQLGCCCLLGGPTTLIFGNHGTVILAHGSLQMLGLFRRDSSSATDSFLMVSGKLALCCYADRRHGHGGDRHRVRLDGRYDDDVLGTFGDCCSTIWCAGIVGGLYHLLPPEMSWLEHCWDIDMYR